MRRCPRCNNLFDDYDDRRHGADPDPDWRDCGGGRCYPCYLGFLYTLYGGSMEPVFKLGGAVYSADGRED